MDEEDEHSPSEFYYPINLETLDAETEKGGEFNSQKPSVILWTVYWLSTGALGPHCHYLGPIFHIKVPDKVNFISALIANTLSKCENNQRDGEMWLQVICGDPSSAVLDKILIGFKWRIPFTSPSSMLVLSWFSLQRKKKNDSVSIHTLHFIKRKSKKI